MTQTGFDVKSLSMRFLFNMFKNIKSPLELQSSLNLPLTPDDQTVEGFLPVLGTYELRGRSVKKSVIPETKFETLTFKHFFPKLLKTFKIFDFSLRRESFRLQVNLNLNENLKIFLTHFPKFDIKYSTFYRKKMKKKSKSNKEREMLDEIYCQIIKLLKILLFY